MNVIAKFEISLRAIKNKVFETRKKLGKYTKVCAVVKANAYGFGLEKIASVIKNHVDYFAVARVYELERLRNYGVYNKVLVLSPIVEVRQIVKALKLNAEITIINKESLIEINRIAENLNIIAKVHLKVDTGMNRFGIKDINEFKEVLETANGLYSVSIVGLYSHFACADNDIIVTEQIEYFERFLNVCHKKGFFPLTHISSSKRAMDTKYAYDMVRLGIDLYEIDDAIKMTGEIVSLKEVKAGECIGYNYSYKACKDMTIACVNIGYGDIAIRHLSNKGKVIIKDKVCDIVGNVCMDCLFVNVTKLDVNIGEYVILFGKTNQNAISICEIADMCGTISYELFTSISERVKRIYK